MRHAILARIAAATGLVARIWRLAAPYWWARDIGFERHILGYSIRLRECWIGRALLAVIIGMAVLLVYASKLLNDWNARFFNALQEKNEAAFWAELRYWVVIVVIFIVIAVYRLWLRQLLTIRWRRWLTEVYFKEWLGGRSYYRMELVSAGADNPEQRIEEDIRLFTEQTLTISLDLLSQIMTLGTFTVVLWRLSGNFVLPVLGGIQIPGYMMWVALVYALLGSWATYRIGRPLIAVNFDLQRYNADFRYRMVRIRENAESIALYRGEPDEERRLGGAFGHIYDTWWLYMKHLKRLTWLNVFYGQVAGIFPIVVAAPRYFAGQIPLGVLTQTAGAFGYVQGSLSWFVDSYADLAAWQATVDRLTGFTDAIAAAKRQTATGAGFERGSGPPGALALEQVEVMLPDGRTLLAGIDLVIERGRKVMLQGPSGSGKTTLFRVLAGLWPFGKGRIRVPEGTRSLFLPQKPYIPIGSLADGLSYPERPDHYPAQDLAEALRLAGLDRLIPKLAESGNWSMSLSPGEQQRLSFARAFLLRPDWLFLDEATSAIDEAMEARLYRTLALHLPHATIVSIAHNSTVRQFHDQQITIDPATGSLLAQPVAAR
jgi:putative ATP-binding cassette transporter